MSTENLNAEKLFQQFDQFVSGVNLQWGRFVMAQWKLVSFFAEPFLYCRLKTTIVHHAWNTGAELFGFTTAAKIGKEHDANYAGIAVFNACAFLTDI